ncbi:MAG: peptidylprolyl isomerase [Pseudomonadota bacterium]
MSIDEIKVAELDGAPVTLADVFRTMRAAGTFDTVLKGLADTIAVRKAEQLGLGVTTPELQEAADTFRDSNGLQKAADTMAWLEARGRSVEDFEASLEYSILSERVRNHVASDRVVTRRFQAEGAAFNAAELSQIVLFDLEEAALVRRSIDTGAIDFFEAAREYSEDFDTRGAGGYIGWRSRRSLPPDLADRILSSEAGEIIGPVPVGDIFVIIRVLAIRAPNLDQATRNALRETIFREWIEEQLASAGAKIPLPSGN